MLRTIERYVSDEVSAVSKELYDLFQRYQASVARFCRALYRVRFPRLWHLKSQARRWDDLLSAAEVLRADRDAMRPWEVVLEALQARTGGRQLGYCRPTRSTWRTFAGRSARFGLGGTHFPQIARRRSEM
ncbi:MAG UNVERIFIED_CONTAM: Ger(x)C family spore germination C-terminal domain-containing protein [Planctomycetaceae bacterium]